MAANTLQIVLIATLASSCLAILKVPAFFNVPGSPFNRGGRVNFQGLSLGQVCRQIMMLGGKEALSDGMGQAAKWFSSQKINSMVAGGTDPQMQCLYRQATGSLMPGAVGNKDPGNIFGDYFDTVIEYPMITNPCDRPQCNGQVNPTVLLMQKFAPRMGMGRFGMGLGGMGGMGGMGGIGGMGGMGGLPGMGAMSGMGGLAGMGAMGGLGGMKMPGAMNLQNSLLMSALQKPSAPAAMSPPMSPSPSTPMMNPAASNPVPPSLPSQNPGAQNLNPVSALTNTANNPLPSATGTVSQTVPGVPSMPSLPPMPAGGGMPSLPGMPGGSAPGGAAAPGAMPMPSMNNMMSMLQNPSIQQMFMKFMQSMATGGQQFTG